ncbi:uncharacterized protein LOC120807969 isoform X3 [Gasterosteus aculeatus]
MSGLLKEIEDIDKPAADGLMNAGLQSDSDIQALTEDDLRDLFPGPENIKRRRANYDLIHSQPMEQQKLEASLTDSSAGSGTSDSGFEILNPENPDTKREVMSGLLKKIEDIYKPAADGLMNADLQSDSDIQALTQDDLRDLLPGPENIKRRRVIYDLIHSQQKLEASLTGEVMSGLLKKIEDIDKPAADELINADLQSDSDIQALTEDDLRDLLPGIKNKKRRRAIYDLIHSQPMEQQKLEASLTGEVMSGLLKEIKRIDKPAADELMNADLQSDSDIQALTEDDLRDLFPGIKNIKRRRAIYDIIHSQPIGQILKKLRGFIPEASLTAALTNNGVLVDYLGLLMDMKTQMDKVMTFIEAHISFLKEYKTNPLEQESASSQEKVQGHLKDTSAGETHESGSHVSPSASDHPEELQITPSDGQPQAAPDSSPGSGTSDSSFGSGEYSGPDNHNTKQSATKDPMCRSRSEEHQSSQSERRPQRAPATSYKMVVGGKTFDAHLTLMKKIKKQVQNQIQSCEDDADNHSVTFVFCPISSRVASDVEAAMSDVKDDKPVILVLMHHTHQVKATSTMKTWDVHANVVLHVNVFYHETRGLLQCDENDAAVTEIQNKLLESFNLKSSITSGNAQGGGAERGGTGPGWRIQGEKPWDWIKASAK